MTRSMSESFLQQVVEAQLNDPWVLGGLACFLRRNEPVAQRHHDGCELEVFWRECNVAQWRCTVFLDKSTALYLAQIDLHGKGTVRVEAHESCSITISPKEDVLCLTRFTPDSRF